LYANQLKFREEIPKYNVKAKCNRTYQLTSTRKVVVVLFRYQHEV